MILKEKLVGSREFGEGSEAQMEGELAMRGGTQERGSELHDRPLGGLFSHSNEQGRNNSVLMVL